MKMYANGRFWEVKRRGYDIRDGLLEKNRSFGALLSIHVMTGAGSERYRQTKKCHGFYRVMATGTFRTGIHLDFNTDDTGKGTIRER